MGFVRTSIKPVKRVSTSQLLEEKATQWLESINARRLNDVDELIAADALYHVSVPGQFVLKSARFPQRTCIAFAKVLLAEPIASNSWVDIHLVMVQDLADEQNLLPAAFLESRVVQHSALYRVLCYEQQNRIYRVLKACFSTWPCRACTAG